MPSSHEQGHQQDRARADARSRRRHDALARPLVRYRVRSREPVRTLASGARAADHQRRSPRPPRDARPRGFRALRRASPLHQGDDFRKKINTTPEQKATSGPEGSGPHVAFFAPVHDQSRREHSRQGIPQYRQTFRSGPFRTVCERSPPRGRLCRRRPSLPPSPSYAERRPVPCKQRPRYARTRNRREAALIP